MPRSKNLTHNRNNLYGVILAGGFGTRLWPVSRQFYPKQFIGLLGDKTLLQQTFLRLKKIMPVQRIYLTTNKILQDNIYIQLKNFGLKMENILIEPELKNTAPAIGLASQAIFKKDKRAILLICPSDHFIEPESGFKKSVLLASKAAENNFLVTIGVKPTCPSSDYGYIKIKSKIKNQKSKISGHLVEKFVEKPDKQTAEKFINEGYFWNAGIFVFKASVILGQIKKYLPEINDVLRVGYNSPQFLEKYSALQPISIDCGVMERADKVWLIKSAFNWCDVGSWKALCDLSKKDKNGNAILSDKIIHFDSYNNLLCGSPKRVVAALGINDLIVVDTEDAVLVAHKDKLSEIKKIISAFKENQLTQHLEHPTVKRPWGSYTVLDEGPLYKVKKIAVLPKAKLSLQAHNKRSEHWVVLAGNARVEVDGKTYDLLPHESIDVPCKARHRLENPGDKILEILEVQNGEYLGEDDIVRFEDKYGRI